MCFDKNYAFKNLPKFGNSDAKLKAAWDLPLRPVKCQVAFPMILLLRKSF